MAQSTKRKANNSFRSDYIIEWNSINNDKKSKQHCSAPKVTFIDVLPCEMTKYIHKTIQAEPN